MQTLSQAFAQSILRLFYLLLLYPHIFFGTFYGFKEIMLMRDFKCCTDTGTLWILLTT